MFASDLFIGVHECEWNKLHECRDKLPRLVERSCANESKGSCYEAEKQE